VKRSLAILLLTLATAQAAPVVVTWDAAPPAEQVTKWRLYKIEYYLPLLVVETTYLRASIEAEPGDEFRLSSVNAVGESPMSDPLIIAIPPPKTELIIERSPSLSGWIKVVSVWVDYVEAEKMFYRVGNVIPLSPPP